MSDVKQTVWQELKDVVASEIRSPADTYSHGERRRHAVSFLAWLCHAYQVGMDRSLEDVIGSEDSSFIRSTCDPIALAKFRYVYGYGEDVTEQAQPVTAGEMRSNA